MNKNTPSKGLSIPATTSGGAQPKDVDLHNFGSFYNDTWQANQQKFNTSEINQQHHGTASEEHYFAHSGIECQPLATFVPPINVPTPTPLTHINLGSHCADFDPGQVKSSKNPEIPLTVVNSDRLGLCIKTEPSLHGTASTTPVVHFSMKYEPLCYAGHHPERVFHFTGSTEDGAASKKHLGINDHMCMSSTKAYELESRETVDIKRKLIDSTQVSSIDNCSRDQGIGGGNFESVAKKTLNYDNVLHCEQVDLEVLQVVDLSSGKEERLEDFNCLSGILALADVFPEANLDSGDDEGTVEVLKVVHLKSRITVDPSFHSVVAKMIDIPKQPQESSTDSLTMPVLPAKISQTFVESQDPSKDLCKGRTDVLGISNGSLNKSNIVGNDKSTLSIRSCEVGVSDILQMFPEYQKGDICKVPKPALQAIDSVEKATSSFLLDYTKQAKIRMHKEPVTENKESESCDQKPVVSRMTLKEAEDPNSNLLTVPTFSTLSSLPVPKPDQLMALLTTKPEQITALTITKQDLNAPLAKANLAGDRPPAQILPTKQEPPSAALLLIAGSSCTQSATIKDLDTQLVNTAEVPKSMPNQMLAISTTQAELITTLAKLDPNSELPKANLAATTPLAQMTLAKQELIAASPGIKSEPSSPSDVPKLIVVPSHIQSTTINTAEVPTTAASQMFVPYQPSPLKPWPKFAKVIVTQPPLPLEAPPPLPPLPPPLQRTPLLPDPLLSPAGVQSMMEELVPRHTYCGDDPQEKADNCSRGWDVLRFAKTSEQKFRQVRRRWGNPPLPNLNRDLSYRFSRTGPVAVPDKTGLYTSKMSPAAVLAKYGVALSACKSISDEQYESGNRSMHWKGSLEHKHSRYIHEGSQFTQPDFRSCYYDSQSRYGYSRSRHENLQSWHGKSQNNDSQPIGESRSEQGDSRYCNARSICRGSEDGNPKAVKRKRSCDYDVDKPAAKRVRLIPCTQVYATKLSRVEMAVERVGHETETSNKLMTPNKIETDEVKRRRRALLQRHRARAAQSERVYAKMRNVHAIAIAEMELFRSYYQAHGEKEKNNFYMTEYEATEILEQERYYSDMNRIYVQS